MSHLEHVRKLLPKLTYTMRKGTCGRVGVIGGSLEYTGAPYFVAISAMKLGADLSHVFCTESAATVIKSFSPSLIVHPGWDPKKVLSTFSRLDCLVLGPGLGRDESAKPLVVAVLDYVKENDVPLVIDADGIFWACEIGKSLHALPSVIYTPNKGELDRMCTTFIGKKVWKLTMKENVVIELVKELAKNIGSSIFVQGPSDIFISSTGASSVGREPGGLRRCGGQGDVTAGTLAIFALWAKRAGLKEPHIAASLASSELVRHASKLAFEKIGRGVETPDIIAEIAPILKLIDDHVCRSEN